MTAVTVYEIHTGDVLDTITTNPQLAEHASQQGKRVTAATQEVPHP